jgi:hypothetical protein
VKLRCTIHAATCKSEEFNQFTKWLLFGGESLIAQNVRHEQSKVIKYKQLVASRFLFEITDLTQSPAIAEVQHRHCAMR